MKNHLKYLIIAGITSLLILTACGTDETPAQAEQSEVVINSDTVYTDAGTSDSGTDDFSHLRIPYVGSAHATRAIVDVLTLPEANWTVDSIQIGADHGDFAVSYSPYTLTIFYEPQQGSVIAGTRVGLEVPRDVFVANSDLLFDLIENLQAVTFSVRFTPAEGDEVDHDFFDYRWSRSRHGEYSLQINHEAEAMNDSFAIHIDRLADVTLGFGMFYEVNYNDAFEEIRGFRFDGEGERLVIWANQPIYNLSLVALDHDVVNEEFRFFATSAVFTVDRLNSAAAEAFVIDSYYGMGTIPWSGITFEDASGTRRYFILQQSGYDGRFHLGEFEPWIVLESIPASAPHSESSLVWIVPPTLTHDHIRLCNVGAFIDS